jgi:hypothetical protein
MGSMCLWDVAPGDRFVASIRVVQCKSYRKNRSRTLYYIETN